MTNKEIALAYAEQAKAELDSSRGGGGRATRAARATALATLAVFYRDLAETRIVTPVE